MPTKQPILHVDMTPDADLPARILRAYRANCDVLLAGSGGGVTARRWDEAQQARAVIFDRALIALQRGANLDRAKKKGQARGRPASLDHLIPVVKKLHRHLSGAQIVRQLAGKASAPWIYQTIRSLKKS